MNTQNHELCTLLRKIAFKDSNDTAITLSTKTIDWALQTGLGACLIDLLEPEYLDTDLLGSLKAEALTAKFWYQTQYRTTLEFITELNKHNTIPTLLKDISINDELLPKAHYLNMRDIDLLVEESHMGDYSQKIILPFFGRYI